MSHGEYRKNSYQRQHEMYQGKGNVLGSADDYRVDDGYLDEDESERRAIELSLATYEREIIKNSGFVDNSIQNTTKIINSQDYEYNESLRKDMQKRGETDKATATQANAGKANAGKANTDIANAERIRRDWELQKERELLKQIEDEENEKCRIKYKAEQEKKKLQNLVDEQRKIVNTLFELHNQNQQKSFEKTVKLNRLNDNIANYSTNDIANYSTNVIANYNTNDIANYNTNDIANDIKPEGIVLNTWKLSIVNNSILQQIHTALNGQNSALPQQNSFVFKNLPIDVSTPENAEKSVKAHISTTLNIPASSFKITDVRCRNIDGKNIDRSTIIMTDALSS